MFAVYLWNVSQTEADAARAERGWVHENYDTIDRSYRSRTETTGGHAAFNANTSQCFKYIRGELPNYPEHILKVNLEQIEEQIALYRSPRFDPLTMDDPNDTMAIHVWQEISPLLLEGLAQLTLGGPMYIYHGGLMHVRFRYFDPEKKRPGLPTNIAALVEELGSEHARLTIANTDAEITRSVIIQGGAFGEHQIRSVDCLDEDGAITSSLPIDHKHLCVSLEAGSVLRLKLNMERYSNRPSYDTPWEKANAIALISGRVV